jgi:hypothetical protein
MMPKGGEHFSLPEILAGSVNDPNAAERPFARFLSIAHAQQARSLGLARRYEPRGALVHPGQAPGSARTAYFGLRRQPKQPARETGSWNFMHEGNTNYEAIVGAVPLRLRNSAPFQTSSREAIS